MGLNRHFEEAKKHPDYWIGCCEVEITEGILKLIDPETIDHKEMTELVEKSIADMLGALKDLKLKEDLWGIDDVCEFLNLSSETIYRIIREDKDKLPYFKITQKIFKFEREEIYKWAEGKKKNYR